MHLQTQVWSIAFTLPADALLVHAFSLLFGGPETLPGWLSPTAWGFCLAELHLGIYSITWNGCDPPHTHTNMRAMWAQERLVKESSLSFFPCFFRLHRGPGFELARRIGEVSDGAKEVSGCGISCHRQRRLCQDQGSMYGDLESREGSAPGSIFILPGVISTPHSG